MKENNIEKLSKEELVERINKVIDYIHIKIQKSFNYDFGFDTTHPSDRLFTETVIEFQIIEDMLKNNNDYMEGKNE